MTGEPHKTREESERDVRSQPEAGPAGPVSPPAPATDPGKDESGGYEKRPRDSSTDNAKGGYGAG